MVFCELRVQADAVCKWSYHGENESEDNLTKFQEGEIDKISVVAKIKRGINLKRANVCIFEGCSSSSTEWEQRAGRFKRLGIDEIAIVIFMVPYFQKVDKGWEPTIVEKWIKKATCNIANIEFKNLKL